MTAVRLLFVAGLVIVAGCPGGTQDVNEEASQLDLTVQNQRNDTVAVNVTVVDENGTSVSTQNDSVDAGVSRVFNVGIETVGAYDVRVDADRWQTDFQWDSEDCVHYDATIEITDDGIEDEAECIEQR